MLQDMSWRLYVLFMRFFKLYEKGQLHIAVFRSRVSCGLRGSNFIRPLIKEQTIKGSILEIGFKSCQVVFFPALLNIFEGFIGDVGMA